MNKEFIPYELALELKQLGFKETCLGWFADSYLRIGAIVENKHVQGEGETLAPTYSQAFRWFREKHGLHSNISSWRSDDNLSFYHEFEIYSLTSSHSPGDEYSTHEEAELACLEKLIKLVNEKNE